MNRGRHSPLERTWKVTRREILTGASAVLGGLTLGGPGMLTHAFAAKPSISPVGGVATLNVTKPLVAPVFEHGEGRATAAAGAAGAVVFLSSEDLFWILKSELAPLGIQLGQLGIVRGIQPWVDPQEAYRLEGLDEATKHLRSVRTPTRREVPLAFTGADMRRKIAALVVCRGNYYKLGGTATNAAAVKYDFKRVAIAAQKEIEKQAKEPMAIGVFYDPLGKANPGDAAQSRVTGQTLPLLKAQESQKQLRQQVQDFVKWLTTQGAM